MCHSNATLHSVEYAVIFDAYKVTPEVVSAGNSQCFASSRQHGEDQSSSLRPATLIKGMCVDESHIHHTVCNTLLMLAKHLGLADAQEYIIADTIINGLCLIPSGNHN